MGGGPSSTTTKTKWEPPKYLQAPLERYIQFAEGQLFPGATIDPNTGQPVPGALAGYPFPNQEVATLSPLQQQGLTGVETLGTESPLLNQAMASQQQFIGSNAISNPLLGAMFRQGTEEGLGQLRGAALRGGGYGSAGSQLAEAKFLSDFATQLYGNAWQQQEAMKQQAIQAAPGLAQGAYIPAQQLLGAGGLQQTQEQNVLNTQFQNEMARAGWPFQAMQLLGLPLQIAGGGGGIQTVQTPTSGPFGPFL